MHEHDYKPDAVIGGAVLWRCDCGKLQMRPKQEPRGLVIRADKTIERLIETWGELLKRL